MPYHWTQTPTQTNLAVPYAPDTPAALRLHLTAHNSLSPQGFVLFFGITGVLMCVPLMAFFGSVFWYGILGYLTLTLGAAWMAIKRSWTRGSVKEDLDVWSDRLLLTRINPDGREQDWDANPYWVKVITHQTGGPVPYYVTLCGSGRDVEIGSFLSEDERKALSADLTDLLNRLRQTS